MVKNQGLTLSFCSQATDGALENLDKCTNLKAIQLENCVNITDKTIMGI